MNQEELRQYIETTLALTHPTFYTERRFRTNEEWDRMSSSELRNESLGGEMEATLEQLLAHRSAVVLGEPGSGKSTVARVAVERTTARGW